MTDNTVSTEILIKIGGGRDAQQQLTGIAAAEAKIKTGAKEATQAQKELGNETRQSGGLIQSMTGAIGRAFDAIIGKSKQGNAAIKDLNKDLQETEDQAKDTANAVAKSGEGKGSGGGGISRLDQGLGTVERFAGSLGSSQINQAAGVAGDALAAGQALAGVGAGLGAVLVAAAPVAAILAGISYGLNLIQDSANKATAALRESYDAQIKDAEQAIQNRDLARTKTTAQNQQDINDLSKDIDDYGKVLSNLRDRRADVDKAYADLGASFNPIRRAQLGAEGQELDKEIAETRKHIDDLNSQFQNSTLVLPSLIKAEEDRTAALKAEADAQAERIQALDEHAQQEAKNTALIRTAREGSTDALKEQIASIGDQISAASEELNALQGIDKPTEATKARIEQLNKTITDLGAQSYDLSTNVLPLVKAREAEVVAIKKQEEALKEAGKAADEYAQNTAKIKDLEQSRAALSERRAREDSRASQVSALEAKIAAAKEVEAAQERSVKIVQLRRDAGDKEAAAIRDSETAKQKVNEAFMRDSLKALNSYRLAETRATQDHNRERVRKLEDLYDSLSDIAARGDVAAFITTQRQGLRDVRRGDEDFGVAAQRRREDFDAERAAALEARNQQLADLRQGLEQQRTAIQTNLIQQIEQEKASGQQKLTQSAALEQQLADLKAQFAAEDQARTRREEDQAITAQIAAIRKRNDEIRPLLTKAIDPLVTGISNFAKEAGDKLVAMFARVRAAAAGVPAPKPRVGGPQALANADGGIYTAPTDAILGERAGWGDAVIGYRQSEGFVPALMRQLAQAGAGMNGLMGAASASTKTVYLTINAGDLVDKAALEELKQDVLGGMGDAQVLLVGNQS